MKLLLDTQCWLWLAASPDRLSLSSRELVENTDNETYLSAVSAWEIAIKHALGKLDLPEPPTRYVPTRMMRLRTVPLSVEHAHALQVSTLPLHHHDPFDRLLIAQAQLEDLPLLTADRVFNRYDVATIPA
jgi:PIN domain nuclease of toxin-antitoxin system